jgi:hypothetical protein
VKTLMLDFDGVLHPSEIYRDPKTGRIYLAEGVYDDGTHQLFEHAELLVDLIEKSGVEVQIILSTSWVRVLRSYLKTKRKLPQGLQKLVTGATWHSAMEGEIGARDIYAGPVGFKYLTRYQQILQYVARHKIPDSDWIAIDDDDHRWGEKHRGNLVHTDETEGLGKLETQLELVIKLKGEWK